jgi:hypothetical protein
MTSQFPAHPAGSFNYPHLDQLPTIAVFYKGIARDVGDKNSHCNYFQLREYALQENVNMSSNMFQPRDPLTIGAKNLADQDIFVTKSKKTTVSKLPDKFRYNISDKANVETRDILEFVPVQTTEKENNQ